jgi:Na+-transporting NADH:ubiquinone oxidoreductase subunit A
LDLPILGEPEPGIHDHDPPRHVALLAADYPGLRPTMHVAVGDEVRRGQLLFKTRRRPVSVLRLPVRAKWLPSIAASAALSNPW